MEVLDGTLGDLVGHTYVRRYFPAHDPRPHPDRAATVATALGEEPEQR